MRAYQHVPARPVSDHVEFLWSFEDYRPPHPRERVLPVGTMELVIDLSPSNSATGIIVGQRTEHFVLETAAAISVIGVHFKPSGAYPFLGPVGDLGNELVPTDDLWGRFAHAVRDQILEAPTPAARFQALERALLSRLRPHCAIHPAVTYALGAIDCPRPCPVGAITSALGMSSRRFIDLFRHQVGITPKAYGRIRRFQRVLEQIEPLADVDWGDVALGCGYFDQAHFIHDFRAFSGITPSSYLRDRASRNHVALRD